jgi:hypothetical protein
MKLFVTLSVLTAFVGFTPSAQAMRAESMGKVVYTRALCNQIAKTGVRAACNRCVSKPAPHAFISSVQRHRASRCQLLANPRQPAIKGVGGCAGAGNKAQRQACGRCLRRARKHVYVKGARAGKRCRMLPRSGALKGKGIKGPMKHILQQPKGPGSVIYGRGRCRSLDKPGLRRNCGTCLARRGSHAFLPRALAGKRCRMLAPANTRAGVRGHGGCARYRNPGQRAACGRCMKRQRKHVFLAAAKAGKRCRLLDTRPKPQRRPAALPAALRNVNQCGRLGVGRKIAACRACVKRRGRHTYFRNRSAGRRCVRTGGR